MAPRPPPCRLVVKRAQRMPLRATVKSLKATIRSFVQANRQAPLVPRRWPIWLQTQSLSHLRPLPPLPSSSAKVALVVGDRLPTTFFYLLCSTSCTHLSPLYDYFLMCTIDDRVVLIPLHRVYFSRTTSWPGRCPCPTSKSPRTGWWSRAIRSLRTVDRNRCQLFRSCLSGNFYIRRLHTILE